MASQQATTLINDVTTATFDAGVIERSKTTPVLVDFWAAWCGPCRMLTPQIEATVAAAGGAVALAKIDVDAEPQLAQRFQISGIPHVKLFVDGREVAHFVGARNQTAIEAFLDEHLGASRFEELVDQHRAAGTGAYADALEAFELGYVDQAFEHLLRDVSSDDADLRDGAKELLLAAFDHFGSSHAAVTRARKQLATILL